MRSPRYEDLPSASMPKLLWRRSVVLVISLNLSARIGWLIGDTC